MRLINYCIGACFTQLNGDNVNVPGYFTSHKLSATQTRWPTIEMEDIVYAVKKLDYILYGAKFTIKTDHRQLIYRLNSLSRNTKIQNWMMQLSPYNITVLLKILRGQYYSRYADSSPSLVTK